MELETIKYQIMLSKSQNNRIKFSLKQQQAYNSIKKGNSIFVTGSAGVGKSQLIKTFIEENKDYKNIGITSTTGISAIMFGGTTLHSFLGIGLGTGSVEDITEKIFNRSYLYKRWNQLELLIIDEISMLSPELFDKLEEVARIIRHNDKPFGGIQLVLSGDFCQLPSIGTDNFCFESKKWNECIDETIYLTEIMRQKNKEFQECLNDIRLGILSKKTRKLLNSRINVELKNDFGIKPTKLYCTNHSVDTINNEELDKLAEDDPDFYEYNMELHPLPGARNTQFLIDKHRKNCNAPQTLQLCIGAQVMLLFNLDLDGGLVNGSRGVVTNFIGDVPVVKFLNGRELVIDHHTWEIEENKKKVLHIIQIPLKLAYAITAHKCCSENTLIYTKNGIKRIKKISSDLFPSQQSFTTKKMSMEIFGKLGLQQATQIYKGDIEETIEITTSLGYVIEGSHRHPILTYNGVDEIWKKLPELKENDYVILKKGTESYGNYIDTSNFIKCKSKIPYNIPKYVDEDLCYLIGLLLGDGCYSIQRDYPIEFTVSENDIDYMRFSRIFSKIFHHECKIYKYKSRTTYKMMVNSKLVRTFLYWCGLDYTTGEYKTIPWVVLENTKKSQIACLSGLFDTDGGVNHRCIHYTTISKQLATDIQIMLLNLNIISIVSEMKGESRKKYKQAYRVHIYGYNAYLFYKNIPFLDSVKQQKLEKKYGTYNCNIPKSNICEIPNGTIIAQNLRDEIYKYYGVSKKCNNIPSECSKLLSRLVSGKQKFRIEHAHYIYNEIYNLSKFGKTGKFISYIVSNNIFYDKIKNITNKKSQLYDLFVPSDHTFIGNGIVNHNSQGATLDCVEVDMTNVFDYGQAYVMLSRVKNIENLNILGIDYDKIKAHPKAIEFYNSL